MKLSVGGEFLSLCKCHTCPKCPELIAMFRLHVTFDERARGEQGGLRTLVSDVLTTAPTEVVAHLPSSEALQQRYHRIRRKQLPPFPTTCHFDIPPPYSRTLDGEDFILADKTIGEDRILVFGSLHGLKKLCEAPSVHSDGTFDVVPSPFMQLYTFHSIHHGKMFPRIFCLTTRRTREIYVEILRILREKAFSLGLQLRFAPQRMTMDFEPFVRSYQAPSSRVAISISATPC